LRVQSWIVEFLEETSRRLNLNPWFHDGRNRTDRHANTVDHRSSG
jgi:hypothetical protein